MCTVVVRWSPGEPLLVLALRDELVGREFDDPGRWWPGQPDVVGGRDRLAGGTWCGSDVGAGRTALVLNRPQPAVAAPGAASRGVLPLAALEHGAGWAERVDVAPMAGFALVLAGPDALSLWEHEDAGLVRTDLAPGVHVVTSRGAEDGKAALHRPAFAAVEGTPAERAAAWQALVAGSAEADDPTSLLVRHPLGDGRTFATVFGQVLTAVPGWLELRSSRTPGRAVSWASRSVTAP